MPLFVFTKYYMLLINTILISLIFSISSSCVGYSDIVREIENSSKEIQSGNIDILNAISEKNLRVAKDSETGTLYYAGLLWYFQNDKKKAIIAFKRSARTSTNPWKIESARLVGYIYSTTFEYGPLSDFYESLDSLDFFASDHELFYYYAISMWSLRKYKELENLVQKAQLATWKRSPKNRIDVLEARFSLQFWQYILDSINNKNNAITNIETLLLDNDAYSLIQSIPFFLERVLDTVHVPDEIYMLIKAKILFLDDKSIALEAYFDLPKKYLLHKNTLNELIAIARQSRQDLKKLQVWLLQEFKKSHNKENVYILSSLAYVLYVRNLYEESAKYYKFFFSLLYERYDPIFTDNRAMFIQACRSYLYITASIEPHYFIERYLRFNSMFLQTQLFTKTLESYLYEMLIRNKYTQLEQDIQLLNNMYQHTSVKLELFHWYSMISLTKRDISMELVSENDIYSSIFTYDFFLTQSDKDIDIDVFFENWFPSIEEQEDIASIDTINKSDINLLVEGYIKFGLFDYAYSIILANVSFVSFHNVKQIYTAMENNNEYYKAYILVNKIAYFTPHALSSADDLSLIYPQAYKEIIHSLTKNNIERSLLFGLMREESSYSPIIRSSANAVGLTQLLFATAKDIADRIDYGEFSLMDPKDNLTLGYEYFKYLVQVLKNPIKAILAYNGGLGNVWKWEKTLNTDNLFLFSAKVPFRETRRYIRKVLSSAMIYGILYYDIDPKDVLAYVSKIRE